MNIAYTTLLYLHITVGFFSVILFWIPVTAKKGGKFHTQSGHWYAKAMYAVGASALVLALMSLIDPMGFKFPDNDFDAQTALRVAARARDTGLFLLAISVLVLVGVRHGLQTIQAKGKHELMRSFDNIGINVCLLLVGGWLLVSATGGSPMNALFYVFAGLCIFTAITNLTFCLKKSVTRAEQIIAHLSAIIGAGIGAHTAFFVFGANRVMSELLTGYAAITPWVLPGIVGTLIIQIQAKRYKKTNVKQAKFN